MRFFLESPAAKDKKLFLKGQVGSMPIYHCQSSSTFWILMMDISGERLLTKYDPEKGVIDKSVSAAVPQNWEGDPQTIGINHITWQDLNHPSNAQRLEDVKSILSDGNFLCLIDENDKITHDLSIDKTNTLVPIERNK